MANQAKNRSSEIRQSGSDIETRVMEGRQYNGRTKHKTLTFIRFGNFQSRFKEDITRPSWKHEKLGQYLDLKSLIY